MGSPINSCIRSWYRSWVHDRYDRRISTDESMGGYVYPMLRAHGDFEIIMCDRPENQDEYDFIASKCRDKKCLLSYVDGGKIVIVRAGFTLADMGVKVLTRDSSTGRTIKRAKTLARAFRLHATLPQINVRIIEGGPELDGACVISRELYDMCVDNVALPGFHPVQQKALIRQLRHVLTHNGRIVGRMVNVDTGLRIKGTAKGQFFVCDWLPEGVHMVTTMDQIKAELDEIDDLPAEKAVAVIGLEPQTSKVAWEDQQTVVNQAFLLSKPEAKDRLNDAYNEIMGNIDSGEMLTDLELLLREEFGTDWAYSPDAFSKLMRWNASAWAIHGMSYLDSPWLTYRLAQAQAAKMAPSNMKRLRIPIPGGIRAQIISQSLATLYGSDIVVKRGTLVWDPTYRVVIAHDKDWVKIIIPTHGGCDLDDFFTLRRSTGNSVIVTRSPNSRGEWSEWILVNPWPGFYDAAEMTKTQRPTQILDALAKTYTIPKRLMPEAVGDPMGIGTLARVVGAGFCLAMSWLLSNTTKAKFETSYKLLPSQRRTTPPSPLRPYTNNDTIRAIHRLMRTSGSFGQWEIADRAWASQHTKAHRKVRIASENAIDPFTQDDDSEDRAFVMADRELMVDEMVDSNRPVDSILARRVGDDRIIPNPKGPVVTLKRVQLEAEKKFNADMKAVCDSLKIPEYLMTLGSNAHLDNAKRALKKVRYNMFLTDQWLRGTDIPQEERASYIREAQEDIILPMLEAQTHDLSRHSFVMALWLACRTLPTSGGKTDDQLMFGTMVFEHLLAALVYFGVAEQPILTEKGQIDRYWNINYNEGTWDVRCVVCTKIMHTKTMKGVASYWSHNGVCKTCRTVESIVADIEEMATPRIPEEQTEEEQD